MGIEITAKDIIARPNGIPGHLPAAKSVIEQVKEYAKTLKEIKGIFSELGIDVGSILGGPFGNQLLPKKTAGDMEQRQLPPQLTPAAQLRLFIKLLQMKYGDITVDELIVKLKNDFGDQKLSNLFGN